MINLSPIDVTGASRTIRQKLNVPVPTGGSVAVPEVTVTVEIVED